MPSLIIPLVSTGNVPQLSVDLIIHSLSNEFQFVESLDATFLHPFVGPLDYVIGQETPLLYSNQNDTKKFSTALELFYNESKGMYVLQQRTPIIQGYLNNFVKSMILPLVAKYEITEIIIVDSYGSLDEDVLIPSSIATRSWNPFSLGTLEVNSVGDMSRLFESSLQLDTDTRLHVTAALFKFGSQSLQQEISTSQQVFKYTYHILNSQLPSLRTIKYCSLFVHEGDNSYDAYQLCEELPQAISKFNKIDKFTPPISWMGVYGFAPAPAAFDEGLYM